MTRFLAFLEGLDADLKAGLRAQLRVLWTHHSTAIEGNTLTLGETAFVLGEGLTVAGKPLKDHQEVVGHARAIDLLGAWLTAARPLAETELFQLHRAVQTEVVLDTDQPIGAWKIEPNGAQVVVGGTLVFNDTYAYPEDVPALMTDWIGQLAGRIQAGAPLLPDRDRLRPFVELCRDAWRESLELVAEYRRRQAERARARKPAG